MKLGASHNGQGSPLSSLSHTFNHNYCIRTRSTRWFHNGDLRTVRIYPHDDIVDFQHLAVLLTPTPIMLTPAATVWMVAIQFPTSSTLLVGHQLSSGSSGNEHTHLFLIDRPTKKNEFRAIVCYYPELVLFIH